MPVTRLNCPHCNKSVELTVTSVTRSRECPHCGKTIILQFTTKETRLKRKALLTPAETSEEDVKAKKEEEAREAPRVLEGDVLRRMMHDPEVQTSARRLTWGASIAGALIVIIVLGNHFQWWSATEKAADSTSPRMEPAAKVDEPAPKKPVPPAEPMVGRTDKEPSTIAAPSPVDVPAPAGTPPATSEQERAIKAVATFLGASTVEERLKTIRDRTMMEPKLREYYAKHGDAPTVFDRVEAAEVDPIGKFTFSFDVVLPTGDRRRVYVGKSTSGDYVVDWASFVMYGEMDWKELMEKRPQQPVALRVLVSTDEYYSLGFKDPSAYGCLRLIDPRNAQSPPIFAYYTRGTTLGREMEFVMRKSFGDAIPMVLTLKYPVDAQSDNQVWLDERLAEGWVTRGR